MSLVGKPPPYSEPPPEGGSETGPEEAPYLHALALTHYEELAKGSVPVVYHITAPYLRGRSLSLLGSSALVLYEVRATQGDLPLKE